MLLTCPVCKALLIQQDKHLCCENNHSFDAAKQGYWNLLLAHKKRSKDPGDNPAMVQARRHFLELGFYEPLSDQVNQLAITAFDSIDNPSILDMGCGEGYYTTRLQDALNTTQKTASIAALDISKHAIKAACNRTKAITWLVASGADTPLPPESLDLQLVLFSRLMPEAFAKPMKPGSTLILAWPGEQHLIELRQLIYQEIKTSHFDPISTLSEQFDLSHKQQVTYPFQLESNKEITALLAMTPHSQRLPPEAKDKICQLNTLPLTLDVNLGVFTRR